MAYEAYSVGPTSTNAGSAKTLESREILWDSRLFYCLQGSVNFRAMRVGHSEVNCAPPSSR